MKKWRIVCLVALVASCSTTSSKVVTTEWDLVAPATGDLLEIKVWVGSSSCNRFDMYSAAESSTEVAITARLRVRTDVDGCTSDLRSEVVTVPLKAPLGARALTGCRPPNPAVRSNGRGQPVGPNCGATG